MGKNIVEINDAYECRAVEILTSINTGEEIGYCLGGILLSQPVGNVLGFESRLFQCQSTPPRS